ncbi:hypothetical protein [Acinetobacter gerneri]|uniref:Uncharacterized protein n=1 Tax=Acinetobacter gerneri DSM 14967 = CIP 107464 = MTCC 9824 TaxID=1120926 RepID=N8ZP14_9GAMM|nr:hypothetical protein [Acinetobacter gerneri]ENV35479.1 hypothetical protein F960_00286 [Acinetobacter gerneri DSM 14967 = CIP 107464 = MTCC 9824]
MKLSAGRPSANPTTKAKTLASLSDTKSTKRINFDVDADQHRKLKIYAANNDTNIKDLLSDYIEKLTSTIE